MITEKDLQEAIAECEGQRNPNANTCMKLAAFYTIKQHMYGQDRVVDPPNYPRMSFASGPSLLNSGTEFATVANSLDQQKIMEVMDELMTTISVLNPKLYSSVMLKLQD